MELMDHFSLEEFINQSNSNRLAINHNTIDTFKCIQKLSEYLDNKHDKHIPIIITDATRWDSKYDYSQHYYKNATAFDIKVKGYSSIELMRVVEELDIGTGRGLYPKGSGFIHLDTRRGLSSDDGRVSRWFRYNGDYYNYNEHYNKFPFGGWLKENKYIEGDL
jgi:hypothetical protein